LTILLKIGTANFIKSLRTSFIEIQIFCYATLIHENEKRTYDCKDYEFVCTFVRVCSPDEKYNEIHLKKLLFIKVRNVLLALTIWLFQMLCQILDTYL